MNQVYKDTLQSIRNFLAVCNGTGTIDFINAAGKDLLRSNTVENIVGRPISDFVDPDFAEVVAEGLDAFCSESNGVPLKLMTVSGSFLDVIMFVSVIEDEARGGGFLIECHDITNFVQSSEAARNREERLNTILKVVDQAVIVIDFFGVISSFNEAAEKIFGYDRMTAIGSNISMIMPEPHRSQHDGYLLRYASGEPAKILNTTRELECVRKDGSSFPAEVTVTEHDEGLGGKSFIGMVRDISQKKKQEARIRFLALHDPLTGLPNRNAFETRLNEAISRAKRGKHKVSLMFIDLDKFKPINDDLGHDAGDFALKTTANRLTKTIRETDMAARIGGDEFVVILESIHNRSDVEKVAQNILSAVRQSIHFNEHVCNIGASIGISLYPDSGEDKDALLKKADEAMYAVKEAGRNDYRFC